MDQDLDQSRKWKYRYEVISVPPLGSSLYLLESESESKSSNSLRVSNDSTVCLNKSRAMSI